MNKMIETKKEQERVLLVGVETFELEGETFQELMDEMVGLTQTAGGLVEYIYTQKLSKLHNKTIVGKGKLEEIKARVEAEEIDLVIFLNNLSPSANQYLEETLGTKVIDRVQLILDIFAMRAKSRAGKLQVELAQYEYLLPRIIGKGLSLSRLGAGIGTRGPGETQLETDRRHIRERIQAINKELEQVEAHRERTRNQRRAGSEYNIGLLGYTNAGKSTLLQQLTDSDTYVQDQLFATLDPLTRRLKIKGHDNFTLTDTVGFIEELPTELIHAFKSTLEEIKDVDLLLHIVDASHPARLMHEMTVKNLMEELGMLEIPMLTVYNKIDLVQIDEFVPTLFPNIAISAYREEDLNRLKDKIWDECISHSKRYTIEIPATAGDLLATYRQNTLVDTLTFDEERNVYLLTGYRKVIEEREE